jgi:hypothetical protein
MLTHKMILIVKLLIMNDIRETAGEGPSKWREIKPGSVLYFAAQYRCPD